MNGARSDDGFTLPELLLAIVIVVILIGSIGEALVVGLKTTDSIGTTFSNSHDSQLLATWLQPDIISAGPPSGVIDNTAVDSGCSTTPAGTTNVVRFQWTDVGTSTTYNAAYRSGGTQLVRYFCTAGGPITKTVTVLHNLSSATWNTSTNSMALTVATNGTSYQFALSGDPRHSVSSPTTTPTTTPTTIPTTTTPTTAPTTTTTTQPCTYGSGSASPSSVAIKVNGSNSNLANNVSLSVTTSGSCSAVSVRFTTHTGGSTQTIALTRSGNTWTGSIGKNAYSDWAAGLHPFTVVGTSTSPTIAFTVTP